MTALCSSLLFYSRMAALASFRFELNLMFVIRLACVSTQFILESSCIALLLVFSLPLCVAIRIG